MPETPRERELATDEHEAGAVRDAYALVAKGYRQALGITGLPQLEAESLRRCLRAALEIAQEPQLFLQR